ASDRPLPLPEPAVVYGVSDPDLLVKAVGEYRKLLNEVIAEARKQDPNVPEFEVPAPESKKLQNATMYFYKIPEELGLDKRVLPNAAVSKQVAVLALTQEHSQRLLAGNPLKIDSTPLADPKKPLSGATYLNWAGMVDTMTPWVEYGVKTAVQQGTMDEKQA